MSHTYVFPETLNRHSDIIMLLCDWATEPVTCIKGDETHVGEFVVFIDGSFGLRDEKFNWLVKFSQLQILGVTLDNTVYIKEI